jgi:hypothetical protein
MTQKDTKELRVRLFPRPFHKRIKQYIGKMIVEKGEELNKSTASIELIDQALKQHGL